MDFKIILHSCCPQLRRSSKDKLVWACLPVHPSTSAQPPPPPPPPPPQKKKKKQKKKIFYIWNLCTKKFTYSSPTPASPSIPPKNKIKKNN